MVRLFTQRAFTERLLHARRCVRAPVRGTDADLLAPKDIPQGGHRVPTVQTGGLGLGEWLSSGSAKQENLFQNSRAAPSRRAKLVAYSRHSLHQLFSSVDLFVYTTRIT